MLIPKEAKAISVQTNTLKLLCFLSTFVLLDVAKFQYAHVKCNVQRHRLSISYPIIQLLGYNHPQHTFNYGLSFWYHPI